MPVVERSVGPPVIWRKEAEKRVDGGEREAFFSAESRMKIVGFAIPVQAVVNAPGRQKAVAAFLGTGRSWPHRER